MNIVFIISSLSATGPGYVVKSLSEYLLKNNQVSIISLSNTRDNKLNLESKINIYECNLTNGKVTKKDVNRVTNLVKKINPDVLFSHGLRSDLINSKIKGSFVKVSTSHNNPFEDYRALYGLLKGFIMALLQMIIFRKLDYVVTLNPKLQRLHEKFLKKNKVGLILNGVKAIKSSTGNEVYNFGNVAVFNKRKNQKIIVYALNNVKNATAIFWGKGSMKLEIQEAAKENELIKFEDFTSDKEKVYSSFTTFVSASKSEGMPLSVLEAISAGKPLILSDIPAHRYIASFLPEEAVLFFSNNLELTEQLEKNFLNINTYKNLRGSIQSSYNKYFSESSMGEKYEKLFKHLLQGKIIEHVDQ